MDFRKIQDDAFKRISDDLSHRVDSVIEEALKRKGYSFDTRRDLEDFIKENCERVVQTHTNTEIFTVKGEQFLVWRKGNLANIDFKKDEKGTLTITTELQGFYFL